MDTKVTRPPWVPAAILLVLAGLGAAPILRNLRVPDVNLCYRYVTADSYDWINNGLYWAGASVAPSLRPPGFPLVIAALWKVGALSLLPVVNFLFLGLSTWALHALLRERHDPWIAATASWFFFANGYVQDFTRYLMAETYATPFLVLAALAFVRAARAPRAWIAFGLFLGAGFLFSYTALPASIGFAAALVAVAPKDLRRPELWGGVVSAAVLVGAWIGFRSWYYHAHAGGPRHGVEALLHPSFSNVTFYVFSVTALVGIVPFALYAAGLLTFVVAPSSPLRWRAVVLGPLVAQALFWFFIYDWADRRFVLYLLPFLTCLLAEGLVLLRDFAGRGKTALAVAAAYLGLALLWNQIRYPSYGFYYFALTPVHFLKAGLTFTPSKKAVLHLEGAQVVRPHRRLLEGLSWGQIDPRPFKPSCSPLDEQYSCLAVLKSAADRVLPAGKPVGLTTPRGWPSDYWSSTQRLSNAFLRPVALPGESEIMLAGIEAVPATADITRPPFVAHCGPYVLARTR